MGKLVVIGIGGTGIACTENVVHMAALGYFGGTTQVVPFLVDPDNGHPRAKALQNFVSNYRELRNRTGTKDLQTTGFLGTPIEEVRPVNPASTHQSIYDLFLLALDPNAVIASRLFFEEEEVGSSKSGTYKNGFYGRTNAGVCFFADPTSEQALKSALENDLAEPNVDVVIFGSSFGGTGASGILNVARKLRRWCPKNANQSRIAIVQLEPYFVPNLAHAPEKGVLVPDPARFKAKAATTYEYLADLAKGETLDADSFYVLGVKEPTVFDTSWFSANSQDNPRLWVELAACEAARDFVESDTVARKGLKVLFRNELAKPFDGRLDADLRSALFRTALFWRISSYFVEPVLRDVGAANSQPGHPWVNALTRASERKAEDLRKDFELARVLTEEVLRNAAILPRHDADSKKEEATRKAFREGFLPEPAVVLKVKELVKYFSPGKMVKGYDRPQEDRQLTPRALARWINEELRVPAWSIKGGANDLQAFVQPKDRNSGGKGNVSVAAIGEGVTFGAGYTGYRAEKVFRDIASADKWGILDAPRRPGDIPSIWARAISFREELFSEACPLELKHIWVGLLYELLIKGGKSSEPPVWELVPSKSDNLALATALDETNPFGTRFSSLIAKDGKVLVIRKAGTTVDPPLAGDVLGFIWPDTIVVPATTLSSDQIHSLAYVGRTEIDRGFGPSLAQLLDSPSTFAMLLKQCDHTDYEKGISLVKTLKALGGEAREPLTLQTGRTNPSWAKWLGRIL